MGLLSWPWAASQNGSFVLGYLTGCRQVACRCPPGCTLLHLLTNQEVLPWLVETGGGMLLSKHSSSSVFPVRACWRQGLMCCWDAGTPEFLLNPPSVRPLIRVRSLKLHPDVQTPLLRENTFSIPNYLRDLINSLRN